MSKYQAKVWQTADGDFTGRLLKDGITCAIGGHGTHVEVLAHLQKIADEMRVEEAAQAKAELIDL